ncbi:hypothetical protein GCM10023094_34580 [Rhodococcus olei]|uniref:Uncharacterized protein n=2 Tax=Rhodococcus olei TaxID=2161675 RepID=A0ABP8PA78_9NOCA
MNASGQKNSNDTTAQPALLGGRGSFPAADPGVVAGVVTELDSGGEGLSSGRDMVGLLTG